MNTSEGKEHTHTVTHHKCHGCFLNAVASDALVGGLHKKKKKLGET